MGALMRSMDWSKTQISDVETLSPALRMMVRLLLANRFPLSILWGPHYCQIYNEITDQVVGERLRSALSDFASWSARAKTVEETCVIAVRTLAREPVVGRRRRNEEPAFPCITLLQQSSKKSAPYAKNW